MSNPTRGMLIMLLLVPIALGIVMSVVSPQPVEYRLLWACGSMLSSTILGLQIARLER